MSRLQQLCQMLRGKGLEVHRTIDVPFDLAVPSKYVNAVCDEIEAAGHRIAATFDAGTFDTPGVLGIKLSFAAGD